MDQQAPAQIRVRELMAQKGQDGWDQAWQEKATPWDAGETQPPLKSLIESGRLDLPKKGRALVPGCGKAYDAIYIASALGFDTLAVDISTTAVQLAKDTIAAVDQPASAGKVTLQLADFFKYTVPEADRFDLVYDYLFFVAIPPSMRKDWGSQMNALVKPGGYLITLVFPMDPPHDIGPPFFVRPEHYEEPLGMDRWEKVLDEVPEVSLEKHKEKERMVVWRRKL